MLNIVTEESKVFSTKERSPVYLCIEIYRPEEEVEELRNKMEGKPHFFHNNYKWYYDRFFSKPFTI